MNNPIRWTRVNPITPEEFNKLTKGRWQAIIPVQGKETKMIGEVAKGIPQENFEFEKI